MRQGILLGVIGSWLACAPPARGDDTLLRIELALKTPRSRDPVLGGARDKVYFQVWIPEGVKVLRGGMCNPFSRDEPPGKHWQAAARLWEFALVQTDFDGVKRDEFTLLCTALTELARKSGHPELEHLPLCFLGMSRGGGMSMQLAELMPERTLASVPVCLEVGPASEATRRIPVLTVFGEKDGAQMTKLLAKLPTERQQGARWGIAVQWGRKHEFGPANNLSFVFLDDVIARRLPARPDPQSSPCLAVIPLEKGWLGDPATWGRDGRQATIASWDQFVGPHGAACWFPSERVAAVWQAFVSATKDVALVEPAGLGDGQPFVLHSASKPVAVKVATALSPVKVELWDAHRRLAERTQSPWAFEIAIPPGIHALYARLITPEGVSRYSRPQTIMVAK
jgi:hypothetical protein